MTKTPIPRACANCGKQIDPERLEFLPRTTHCVRCVDTHGPKVIKDPEILCAKSSPSGQNGFSPKD